MREQSIKAKKQILSILVLLLLIAITFFFYLRGYSFQALWSAMKNANPAYLLAGLGMMLVFILCEAVNIRVILKTLGQKAPLLRCLEYSNIGFYFSSITPSASGGQPAQIYYMKQDTIPVAMSSATIFFVVYVYQIAMLLLGLIMSLLHTSAAAYFIHQLNYLFLFGVVVNTSVIFILFALMFSKRLVPAIASVLFKVGRHLHLVKKEEQTKDKFDKSLISFHDKAMLLKDHPTLFVKVLLITMLQMISINLIPSLVYLSMGYGSKQLVNIFTCQSLLTISVSPVPLPGAEGVTQGGFLQVFGAYFPKDILPYAMLINRCISFYLPLIISLLFYILTHIRTTKQSARGDMIDR